MAEEKSTSHADREERAKGRNEKLPSLGETKGRIGNAVFDWKVAKAYNVSVKRVLTVGILALGVLGIAGAVVIGRAFRGRQAITDGFEINGIRMVQDGFSSVAVLPVGEGEVALVDAGNGDSGTAILAELSRRGLGPEAVKAVLITHGHGDHTAGIGVLPNAEVMALEAEIPLVEGRRFGARPAEAAVSGAGDRHQSRPRSARRRNRGAGGNRGAGLRRSRAYGRKRGIPGKQCVVPGRLGGCNHRGGASGSGLGVQRRPGAEPRVTDPAAPAPDRAGRGGRGDCLCAFGSAGPGASAAGRLRGAKPLREVQVLRCAQNDRSK